MTLCNRTFILGLFLLTAGCTATDHENDLQVPSVTTNIALAAYTHTGKSKATITFNQALEKPAIFTSQSGKSHTINPDGNSYNLDFFADKGNGDQRFDEQYYTLSFTDSDEVPVKITLIRHSAEELWEVNQFRKPTGYTILGKTNLNFANGDTSITRQVPSSYGYKIPLNTEGEYDFDLPKLNLAAQIVRTLYRKPMKFGPSNAGQYKSISDRFKALQTGEDAVQCADYRDLFLHAAHHHGLNVRLIGLYNYAPQLPDLVSYSHAIVEIETSLGWIAVDPWSNIAFEVSGKFASVEELREAFQNNIDDITFVSLNPGLKRVDLQIDGTLKNVAIIPTAKNTYARYFGAVEFINIEFY